MRRRLITFVQQGVWAMPLESMPLAVGYLKAAVDADHVLSGEFTTKIVNLRGGTSVGTATSLVFAPETPDVLAISVFGWNFREALLLAETFKQLNPSGLVLLGGTHVANQAERVFRMAPDVDVVFNGEGELALPETLHAWIDGKFPEPGGHGIDGISFRGFDGAIVTTKKRAGIADLGTIVSPFLGGAIPMTDANGRFRYDVAIMETNRGCPYHCAFCYWGGAIGQKVRRFPRERLVAELEMFAHYQVNSVVLCDANFGMQREDEDFLDDVIALRERTGYPRALEASWAKNKSETFFRIVRKMKAAGLHSSFTIALQTLNDEALREMNRRNMRLNDWQSLVERLTAEGLECYAELIWGAPGDTPESFLAGYDSLSLHVPRIATYPLMVLPNTDYAQRRAELGLVTTRGDGDDFEYVLASKSMSYQENLRNQGFLLWARAAAENSFFRYIWRPLLAYAGLTQSQVLFTLASWFDEQDSPAAEPLKTPTKIVEPLTVNAAVRALFLDPVVRVLLEQWWSERIRPRVAEEHRWLADEVFRFDLMTLPITEGNAGQAEVEEVDRVRTCRRSELFAVDVPAVVRALRLGEQPSGQAIEPTMFDLSWRLGLEAYIDNHEEAILHMGVVKDSHPVSCRKGEPRPEPSPLPRTPGS
jgi:radical SAM C-methyltransferase